MNTTSKEGSLFELDGVPKLSQAFPLALQHVVAMIVGCVTPAIIISGAAGLETADRVLLIQLYLHLPLSCSSFRLERELAFI